MKKKGISLILIIIIIVIVIIVTGAVVLNLNSNNLIESEKGAPENSTVQGKNPLSKTPYIPEGFKHIEGTIDSGYVIQHTVSGNEFVWVPVDGVNVIYDRNMFATGKAYIEEDTPAISTSVSTYGGFYIARYEAGVNGTARKKVSGIESSVLSQKGKNVYNFVTLVEAKILATRMKEEMGLTDVTTTLITSYLWETTLKWIEQDSNYEGDNYITNSTGKGNYRGSIETTGYNENWRVKNIYDMAGNVWEWSTESWASYVVFRGGSCAQEGIMGSVSCRTFCEDEANEFTGFRVALYK